MMTLLIVDDEELTRKGLIHSLDLNKLNITTVYEAANGREGLTLAHTHRPDIILCDIRMPKMDGIEMATRLRGFLPEAIIIFMSGYSDLDYLKAAIRLKAIRYVEKPISVIDVDAALKEAVTGIRRTREQLDSKKISLLAREHQLALDMTLPPSKRPSFEEKKLQQIHPSLKPLLFYTTFLVWLNQIPDTTAQKNIHDFHNSFNQYLKSYHFDQIHVTKHDSYIVYHVFSKKSPSSKQLFKTAEYLKAFYSSDFRIFIAIGDTVYNIEKAYESYTTAVILMQSSFFYDYGSILAPNKQATSVPAAPAFGFSDPVPAYTDALQSRSRERICRLEDMIYHFFYHNRTFLPNQVKDIYYKLLMAVQNAAHQMGAADFSADSLLESIQSCHTLVYLHKLLTDYSQHFFESFSDEDTQNPLTHAIKSFIHKNYGSSQLSVKDISEHIHRSGAYTCTLFKSETGITLNQYISNYRIERAKQLLDDSQFKISQIAEKTGYADSNYFSKAFRKQTGMSPSEYREHLL